MTADLHLRWEAPPVYFMHIPKTAGRALSDMLRSVYREQDVMYLKAPNHLQGVYLADLNRRRCYLCHFGPGLFELVRRPDLPCLTVLRDPIERALSLIYFHQWRVSQFPELFSHEHLERWAPFAGADLRTLLGSDVVSRWIENGQTRFLGTTQDLRPFLRDGAIGSRSQPLLAPIGDEWLPLAEDMGQIVANAHHQLDRMTLVGITEQFDASVALIGELLGVPLTGRTFHSKIGPQKRQVELYGYRTTTPRDLIEQVASLTRYDQELYAYATDLFEQQWARYQARPRRSYSIASWLRQSMNKVRFTAKGWIKRKWPGLVEYLKRRKADGKG